MPKKFKKFKVFDCQDMPSKVKKKFLKDNGEYNNDVVLNYYVNEPCEYATKEEFEKLDKNTMSFVYENEDGSFNYEIKGKNIISEWLVENGAKVFEEVLIKHWW